MPTYEVRLATRQWLEKLYETYHHYSLAWIYVTRPVSNADDEIRKLILNKVQYQALSEYEERVSPSFAECEALLIQILTEG